MVFLKETEQKFLIFFHATTIEFPFYHIIIKDFLLLSLNFQLYSGNYVLSIPSFLLSTRFKYLFQFMVVSVDYEEMRTIKASLGKKTTGGQYF